MTDRIAVAEEVAVIGVDNEELLCQMCDPPLSTVVPNAERIGYEAAELLDRLMSGESAPEGERLIEPVGVITRQSTDTLAISDPEVATAVRFIRENACSGIKVTDVLLHVPLSRSLLYAFSFESSQLAVNECRVFQGRPKLATRCSYLRLVLVGILQFWCGDLVVRRHGSDPQ